MALTAHFQHMFDEIFGVKSDIQATELDSDHNALVGDISIDRLFS